MGQKKLIRFAELETFPHVFQYPTDKKGRWNEFFGNQQPLTLELACGKGEYAVGLGRMHRDRNFIGVDQKGNRLWVGAKMSLKENLTNVAFLRTQIDQITNYFEKDEVSEIWITFPDPQLRLSKARKRLTHPKFLNLYRQFLQPGGCIHLKTDSPVLYQFTLDVIEIYELEVQFYSDNLYTSGQTDAALFIKTHYEQLDIAQSNKIHYIRFTLPVHPLPDREEQLKLRILERANERGS